MPRPSHAADVIVAGAGMAGLTAARTLAGEGLEVLVLEARDRVGGRVWSPRLTGFEVVEMGGEWIVDTQHPVISLAEELGLDLVDTGMDFAQRDAVGEEPIDSDAHNELSRQLASLCSRLGDEALATMTAAELLGRLDARSPAFRVLESRLTGTAGADLATVAAAEIGEEFGIGDSGRYVRVAGGNDRLAKTMAGVLDVRLVHEVTGVAWSSRDVIVEVGGTGYHAWAAIIAVPLPILRRIDFRPALPSPISALLDSLRMGVAAKVAVAVDEVPPMFRRQDLDIPAWYWTGRSESDGVRRAITGFGGTERAVAALVSDPIGRLRRAAPEASTTARPIVQDWGRDPYAGGCYSVIGPGQRSQLGLLAKPIGNLFLAGEHVNGTGTIAGAIQSGQAAARAVLETRG